MYRNILGAGPVDQTMTGLTLGTFGVFGRFQQWKQVTAAQLSDIEALGYGAIWAGGSPPAELDWIESILEPTKTLKVATGIVNIWSRPPVRSPSRFTASRRPTPEDFYSGSGPDILN